MFCYKCGKELRENARFCFNCGTPVREITGQAGSSEAVEPAKEAGSDPAAAEEPAALTAEASGGTADLTVEASAQEAPDAQEMSVQENPDMQEAPSQESPDAQEVSSQETPDAQETLSQETPDAQEASSQEASAGQEDSESTVQMPADLVLKKGRVTVSGNEIYLNKKHYVRRSGRKKFRKEKKPVRIPLASISGVAVEHHKYGGRMFLSLLLLLCFAAGTWYSARYGYDAYLVLNTPYRDKELAEQESIMAVIDGDGGEQLLQYQGKQEENHSAAEALSENLTGLEAQRTQEILNAIFQSDSFDLDPFFNRELFSRAYQEYLQELADAFKADEALHSWLYSYYETMKAYGGNYFLDTDMWIYNGDGENKFSSVLDSAARLMSEQYDLDLYEHIMYTGRIYITGADFMRVVLSLPRYTVDGAVFAKAYGGVPEASEMSVPGWSRSHYEEFWLYGIDYYSVDTPMWLDYGLSAREFSLDWNSLIDESAYYDAYQNFMGKIAPGLPCYEMASYYADDAAYGGMGCRLKGTEPSVNDIIASYAEGHPEFIEELMENAAYGKLLTTSVDEEIAETKAQLEELEKELLDLQEQEKELAQLLADADVHRNDYTLLLTDIEQHRQEFTFRLLSFGGAGLLCLLGVLICLCRFFSFMKRPRHLFIISRQDMEYAFNTKRFPREQIETLQSRLSE